MDKFEHLARKLISMQEHELAKELKRQYEIGWHDGQLDLFEKLNKKFVGGQK